MTYAKREGFASSVKGASIVITIDSDSGKIPANRVCVYKRKGICLNQVGFVQKLKLKSSTEKKRAEVTMTFGDFRLVNSAAEALKREDIKALKELGVKIKLFK